MTCAAFHVISSEFQFFFFFFFFNREAINRVCEAAGLKTAKKRKVPYILNCHYLCHRNIMEVHWIIKSIYSRPGWVLYFPPSKPLAFCCVYDKDFLLRFCKRSQIENRCPIPTMYGAQHVYLGHCDICFFEWKSSLYKLLL